MQKSKVDKYPVEMDYLLAEMGYRHVEMDNRPAEMGYWLAEMDYQG